MGAVWLQVRHELRARWRTLVVLALVVGLGGGVALAALAGARRTDSAMTQFVSYSLPDDGGFEYGNPAAPPPPSTTRPGSLALPPVARAVVGVPQVAAYYRLPEVGLTARSGTARAASLSVLASPDADFMHRVDRPLVVAGRLPVVSRPFDAALNELAAEALDVRVGSTLSLHAYSAAQVLSPGGATGPGSAPGTSAPAGPRFTVHITGIFRRPTDVSAVTPMVARQHVAYEGGEDLYLTPAFVARYSVALGIPVQALPDADLVAVRLHGGTVSYRAFAAAATRAGRGQVFVGNSGNVAGVHRAAASAQRAIHLETLALVAFGLLAAVLTLLLVGQAVGRQVLLQADDYAVLRSLGAGRAQLVGAAVLRAAAVGAGGGLLAAAVAFATSPLMPIAVARQAEIHPGTSFDPAVLLGGAAALALLLTARAVLPAIRASRPSAALGMTDERPARRSRSVAGALAGPIGSSPSAGIGVRFGLQRGSGRGAVPVVSALLGAILAVAGTSAALTFASSLSHLEASPRQQGWNWDALVGSPSDFTDRESQYAAALASDPQVGSYSAIAVIAGAQQGNAYVKGVALDSLLAFDELKGSVHPTLVAGRAPSGPHEIVFGTRTLEKLHKHVGDRVQMDVGPPVGRITLHIVGAMIAPSVGDIFTNSMGDGGWISGGAFRAVQAQIPSSDAGPGPPQSTFSLMAVRYAPGTSPSAGFAGLERRFGPVVLRRLPPMDVVNLHSVNRLPLVLSGLVALVGLATIGHTLVTSVRRRRRDLAVLKTMGFVRRQVAATVAWQATSFVVVALVVGLPLGVAGGRWAWNAVAGAIDAPSPPVVPLLALMMVVPAALVAANALAAAPGWVAARVAPATVLRSE